MIKIEVLLFAGIRDSIGQEKLQLNLTKGSTLKQLMDSMFQQYPEIKQLFLSCQFIVNCSIIDPDYELKDQDEVAVLPPLGGG